MRCPNCNKFVSYDEPEVEDVDSEVSDDELRITCRVILKCSECGGELKDSELEETVTIEHKHNPDANEDEPEFEVELDDGTGTARTETTKKKLIRRGKLKGQYKTINIPYRYAKTFYGAEVNANVKCTCGWSDNFTVTLEDQASAFNELV